MPAETLTNQVILVAGGTGGVGEEIVRFLLGAGATVAVPSRSDANLQRLRDYCADAGPGQLHTLQQEMNTPDGADNVRAWLRERTGGRLDAVVAALNGRFYGKPFHTLAWAEWQDFLANYLTAHFLTARTFLPLLEKQGGGRYLMINGGAADAVYPGAVELSVAASAQLAMTKGMALETAGSGVQVSSLVIYSRVATRHEAATYPGQVTSQQVAEHVAALLTSSDYNPRHVVHALHLTPASSLA
ncbi:SDR family NAD(P)-dependent oxidoreductase [Hymenobacter arizonensis]|uniref:NAD(P)-dependent dehydrogenase, short-chain alcohol dehydrogenase family n=1 Tax=Hymenobacter arizonensis TaxID=1227077 RepID=A0A1I6BJS5_HYMAR|nr:SDR family oxidoreductase [Hymenobacter arizonensis]SFQ81189.1 NAD(P)-dependent dehydrogenase, short-chain alcohol dehydrogenase family [Hymenobacter arizonensis]